MPDKYVKKIIVLNYSGHGSATGDETVLQNQNWHFDILLNVDDSGGHTGVLNEWLLFLSQNPNTIEDIFDIKDFTHYNLPCGDFKTILTRWLSKYDYCENGKKISNLLGSRVLIDPKSNIDNTEVYDKNKELLKLSKLETYESELNKYLKEYFEFLNTERFKQYSYDELLKGNHSVHYHSIGNIFLQFILFLKDGLSFEYLKNIGWTPENVEFRFIHPTRLTLQGEYRSQNLEITKIVSEKDIDNCVFPLDNLYYIDPKTGSKFKTFIRSIRQLVWESDAIISFAGSPANRTPIFEHFQNTLAEYPRPIIIVANAFQGAMDQPVHNQIQSIFDMGIKPIVLAPKKNPIDYILDSHEALNFIHAYAGEGKTPFNKRNFDAWFNNFKWKDKIKTVLEMHPAEGLKYYPSQICVIIQDIINQ